MTQDPSIRAAAPGNMTRVLRDRRFLIIAGGVVAAIGITMTAITTYAALHAPLDIRGFLESEKAGTAYGPDLTTAWVWAAVAAIGLVVLIVGLARRSKDRT